MSDTYAQFQQRLAVLGRKHRSLANGYTALVGADGLIVLKPSPVRHSMPVRGIFLTALCFVAFKGFMLAAMGSVTYQDRVDQLSQGTVVEKAGAWVMQIDPATEQVGTVIRPMLR